MPSQIHYLTTSIRAAYRNLIKDPVPRSFTDNMALHSTGPLPKANANRAKNMLAETKTKWQGGLGNALEIEYSTHQRVNALS